MTDQKTEQLTHEIERTRRRMEVTIDEIGDRLNPQKMANRTQQKLREATVGRMQQVANDAAETAQETTNSLMQTVRENPIPVGLAAIGIGWLAMNWRSTSDQHNGNGHRYYAYTPELYATGYGYDYDVERYPAAGVEMETDRSSGSGKGPQQQARQTADEARRKAEQAMTNAQGSLRQTQRDLQQSTQQAMSDAQDSLRHTQRQIQHSTRRAEHAASDAYEQNPLGMALLAFGAGAAFAMLFPETKQEREMMRGPAHKAMDQVQSAASDVLDKVDEKAHETGQQVRSSTPSSGGAGSTSSTS